MRQIRGVTLILLLFILVAEAVNAQQVVSLTWNDVVGLSRHNNLRLKIKEQEYREQRLNEWKSLSDFLPTINYNFQAVNNVELPEFVFMGRRFRVGTNYNFAHNLQLQYPLFTGGLRYANWQIQKNVKKSLKEELQNLEDQVVLDALEAYFNIMLSDALIDVNRRAYDAAKANLEQVKKFYDQGAASRLDYLRAKSRFSSTIPNLTSARNNKKMALENMKYILNLDPADSLVILDSLKKMDFLQEFERVKLEALQELALGQRSDLKQAKYQREAAKDQKIISASQFLPSIVFNASVQHQAQIDNADVAWDDYTRSKTASISLRIPLFQGAKRVLDYQQAHITDKRAKLQVEQFKRSVLLDVENGYNQFQEASKNLTSLLEATEEAREALRLANLSYQEGLSTQVDVLSALLAFTQNEVKYQQGIFQYNVSQLRLLKAIGKLDIIWNQNRM